MSKFFGINKEKRKKYGGGWELREAEKGVSESFLSTAQPYTVRWDVKTLRNLHGRMLVVEELRTKTSDKAMVNYI